MADGEDNAEETLLQKHKKERKDLQAQIQKLKHSVPKGDKKKKKEITEQIAKLEAEFSERQEQELKELKSLSQTNQVTERLETLNTSENCDSGNKNEEKQDRTSKAQKRRDKKNAKDKEREQRIKEQEIENLTGSRNVEFQQMKSALKSRGLQIFEIPSDGNCLYNAVSHQLQSLGIKSTNESLRSQTAQYMRDNPDDFLPFLTKDNGDLYTLEDFSQYCKEVEKTTAWGGQIEIQAMSHVLKLPMEVIQTDVQPVKIGEQFQGKGQSSVILTYHKHAYGLGEHYNSVEPYREEEEEEF